MYAHRFWKNNRIKDGGSRAGKRRRKIATVHKKESFKPVHASVQFGGAGRYPSTSPEPPSQFFIRGPETLRHMAPVAAPVVCIGF